MIAGASQALAGTRSVDFDDSGRVVEQRLFGGIDTYDYSEVNGRKYAETVHLNLGSGSDESNDYLYNAAGKLVGAKTAGVYTYYEYDSATGSITSRKSATEPTMTLSYGPAGELKTVGSRVYAYDSLGRRTSEASTSGTDTVLNWSGRSLVGVTKGSRVAKYVYGPDGQRTRSVVTSASVTTTTSYYYDGMTLLGVAGVSGSTTFSVDYAYDGRGQLYAGVYRENGMSPGLAFTIHVSDRGDVRELLDANGKAFAVYTYDAYGRPIAVQTASNTLAGTRAANIATRQPLRYAGYVYDNETGLYYVSQRYYDPVTMQFISRDPARADGEESPYQYCGGDPITQKDPTGLAAVWGVNAGTKYDAQVNAYARAKTARLRRKYRDEARRQEALERQREAKRLKALAAARAARRALKLAMLRDQDARNAAEAQQWQELSQELSQSGTPSDGSSRWAANVSTGLAVVGVGLAVVGVGLALTAAAVATGGMALPAIFAAGGALGLNGLMIGVSTAGIMTSAAGMSLAHANKDQMSASQYKVTMGLGWAGIGMAVAGLPAAFSTSIGATAFGTYTAISGMHIGLAGLGLSIGDALKD